MTQSQKPKHWYWRFLIRTASLLNHVFIFKSERKPCTHIHTYPVRRRSPSRLCVISVRVWGETRSDPKLLSAERKHRPESSIAPVHIWNIFIINEKSAVNVFSTVCAIHRCSVFHSHHFHCAANSHETAFLCHDSANVQNAMVSIGYTRLESHLKTAITGRKAFHMTQRSSVIELNLNLALFLTQSCRSNASK